MHYCILEMALGNQFPFLAVLRLFPRSDRLHHLPPEPGRAAAGGAGAAAAGGEGPAHHEGVRGRGCGRGGGATDTFMAASLPQEL